MNALPDLRAIAERAIHLDADKQELFLTRLAERGFDVALLPIVARTATGARTPLSFAQRRLYLVERTSSQALYNLTSGLVLDGDLDVDALRGALDAIVARHDILRTVYREVDGVPQQSVLPAASLALVAQPLAGDVDAALRRRLHALASTPFALDRDAPLRVELYILGERRHALVWCVHHIAFDAWSEGVLQTELVQAYSALVQGRASAPEPLAVQYADFAAWEALWQRSASFRAQSDAWREALAGVPTALDLPFDYPRPTAQARRHAGDEVRHVLPPALARRLYALTGTLAPERATTLYTLLQTAFGWLLARYGNADDLCLATSVANRRRAELEPLIGFLVNTLAIRHRVSTDLTFRDAAVAAGDTITAAFERAEVPFEHVLERLEVPRDGARPPLCQVLFVLQNVPDAGALALPGLTVAPLAQSQSLARYDLSLRIAERRDDAHLGLHLEYSTELFACATVERLLEDYAALLEQVCADPDRRFGEIALPHAVSLPAAPAPASTQTAQTLLWQQPSDAVAVRDGDTSRTYGDLRHAAGRLAGTLASIGVDATAPVALCLPRTFAQLVAMAAAWHRGAAWLPLDPAHPPVRQCAVLADSGARVVIGTGPAPDWLPESVQWIDADAAHDRAEPLRVAVSRESPAYLIYTSGSTGTPKGVVVSHGNLAHYVAGVLPVLDLSADAVLATLSTVAADLGFTAIFGALLSGRCLRLLPAELSFDAQALSEYLHRYPVDSLKIVPSHLAGLLAAGAGAAILPQQCLVTGGEALTGTLVRTLRELAQDLRIVNHYGPTETTVGILTQTVPQDWPAEQGVPVGMPLVGNEAWVLDRYGLPAPIGVAGELLLGGGNLSLGYWRRDAETAERFVPHPFAPGRTLYRSGDRAKRDAHGRIVYLGRADHQVKIRGHRVELGEVEAVLAQLPGVEVAAVLAIPGANGALQLAACVQGALDGVADALAQRLPEALCPSRWRSVDAMPRLGNGKIDRQALAALLQQVEGPAANDDADTHPVLRELWETLLGRSGIGAHENFFALGGDSILSLQVVARARQAGLALTPQLLFDHPTLAGLSAQLVTAAPAVAAAPDDDGEPFGLTPIQHWFFEQPLAEPQHWNMSVCVQVPERLDAAALGAAVRAVVERHPMLRARFPGERQQQVGRWDAAMFAHADIDAVDHPAQMAQWQRSLDLARGPLFRALYLSVPGEAHGTLLLAAHHLVVDGVSWRIVLDDLQHAYRACREGSAPQQVAPAATFAQWQRFLADGVTAPRLQAWRDYWSRLDGAAGYAQLPFADAPNRECDTATVRVALDRATTARLFGDAPRAFRTQPQELLFAALALALAQVCGGRRVLVELEGHGREPLDTDLDLSGTVGWFTSRYPVLVDLPGDLAPAATLVAVKDQCRDIPDRGLGYGVLRYLHGELAGAPAAQVCFNYLGQVRSGGDGAWRFAAGDDGGSRAPTTPRRHLLDVGAIAVDGVLGVDWTWPRDAAPRALIERLGNAFVEAVHALLALGEATAQRLTRSDVALAALDDRAFAQLAHRYDDLDDAYPASPLQQGLLFHALDDDAAVYVNQTTVTLEGTFDADAFAQAWRDVVARHAILRTGFAWDGLAQPLQLVRRDAWPAVRVEDVDARNLDAALAAAQHTDRTTPFVLDAPPLMRVRVLRVTPSPPSSLGGEGWGEGATLGSSSVSTNCETSPPHPTLSPNGVGGEGSSNAASSLAPSPPSSLGAEGWGEGATLGYSSVSTNCETSPPHPTLSPNGVGGEGSSNAASSLAPSPPSSLGGEGWGEGATLGSSSVSTNCETSPPHEDACTKHLVVWTRHHLIVDGWSSALLIGEVLAAYAARARGEAYAAPPPPSYRDFLAWLARQDHAAALRWWTRSLAGIGEPARLPAPREPVPGHAHRRRDLDIAAAATLAAAHGVTFATVLQGALALVLRHYYGRDDVTVGLTSSGRPADLPGVERMLGVFINTLPLRVRVDDGATLAHWLAELQRRALALRQHEHVPLAQVQTLSGLPGGTALFDTLLVLENYPAAPAASGDGLRVIEHAGEDLTHYPLALALVAVGDRLHAHASFDTQAVDAALVDDLLDDLTFVLDHLPALTHVGALPPLPSQRRWIVPVALPAIATAAPAPGAAAVPRTALEWQLRDAWREVLARDDVGIDDDFFELGGHSLLAMRLLGRLRRLQGQDLPLATVFAHPTVARMADFLATRSAGANALVRLRAGDAGVPLFCLHPGGGHTLAYAPALERLPAGVGAFGVNSRMLVDNDWRPAGRDALLDDYMALIRAEQPHGPYRLLGWSLGGTLAYALAERLERAGERVAFVGLIDCFGWRETERVAHPALAGLVWLPEYLAFLEPPQREVLYRQPRALADIDAALVAADDEAARQAVLAARYAALAGESAHDAERHLLQLRLFRAWDDVLHGYAPGALAAPVLHWQAADSVVLFGGTDDAWQAHAAVTRRTLPGDHYSLMQSPQLAEAIAAAVENDTCR